MSTIVLEAQLRPHTGKAITRRLRRLENKVPAVIYGGNQKTQTITFNHFQLIKVLEDEKIYASVLNIKINQKTEQVILKDLQRHPYKPLILHLDLQRVSDQDILVKSIPIHFINADEAPGLKEGGIINHHMTQVEVRCAVKNLPAFIEVDVRNLNLNDVIHLSQIQLPQAVTLTVDLTDLNHDSPVVSLHLPKVVQEEEIQPEAPVAVTEGDEEGTSTETLEGTAPHEAPTKASDDKKDHEDE